MYVLMTNERLCPGVDCVARGLVTLTVLVDTGEPLLTNQSPALSPGDQSAEGTLHRLVM